MNKLVLVILWLGVFGGPVWSQGFIKPVSGTPDYNGTYQGKPNSGNLKFSTLYRDNQDNGYQSGCRGEGCGRHPGVDIMVPSGTSVVNPLTGVVVVSRCIDSWGGLVVIRSGHPYRAGENVFQVFAHLKSRTYNNGVSVMVGDMVAGGTVIGKSGGNSSTDVCSGNSSGSHLHYQIDKDDGSPEPYFPSSGLHSRDDNFAVTNKTYNPLVFLQGGYRWSFEQNNNRELWDLYNFASWGMGNGALWMDGKLDPYIRRSGLTNCGLNKPCSSSFAAESSEYRNVYLDLSNSCTSTQGKIYFTTNYENFWDENKTISYFPTQPLGSFRKVINASGNPRWNGVITGLRIDPSENCSVSSFDPTYFGEVSILR